MTADAPAIEILDPGLHLSVQDGGRPGMGREGVTRGGAADRRSLAIANVLVGNPADAAALEATILGPQVRALRPITVGLAGTMAARVTGMSRSVQPGHTITLAVGDILELDAATGARGYLAVPGGIDVPLVLGSRSTALGAGFGGFEGRAVRAGDRLAAADPARVLVPARWSGNATAEPADPTRPLRVIAGPDARALGAAALQALAATEWVVSPTSDRVGLRLDGPPLDRGDMRELASHGVVEGTIQVPPDGRPIVLCVDHQPTGGYPVIGVVVTADLPRLGQLAPGAAVGFELVSTEAARTLLVADRDAFDATLGQLRHTQRQDGPWGGASG